MMVAFSKILLVSSLFLTTASHADKIWTPQTKIFDKDGHDDDFFGNSLAINGNNAVVGAYGKHVNKGAVYALSKPFDSSDWSIQQEISPPINMVDYGLFGHDVAIDGDIMVISAIFDDENDYGSGSIYIYQQDKDNSSWEFQQKLIAPDGEANDFFGYSVSVKDNTIVAGAFGHVSNTGAIYIFTQNNDDNDNGNKWSFSQKLTPPENTIRSHFGRNHAFDGKSIVVGAHLEDGKQEISNQGSVYVYLQVPEGGLWELQQKLTSADPKANEYFGMMVAVQDDTLVVLSGRASTTTGVAHTFIYNENNKMWERQEGTVSPIGGAGSVALDGNKLVIGSRNDKSGWIYARAASIIDDESEGSNASSMSWKLEQKLVSYGDDASFASSVAIQDNTIFVGANDDHSFRGSVYTFNLSDDVVEDDKDTGATVASSLRGRKHL